MTFQQFVFFGVRRLACHAGAFGEARDAAFKSCTPLECAGSHGAFKSCALGVQSLRSVLKRSRACALQTAPFHISRVKLHASKPLLLAGIAALAIYTVPNIVS